MERKRIPLEPILQQSLISYGSAFQGILDVLTDHEQRLQRLEGAGVRVMTPSGVGEENLSSCLVALEAKIQALTDEGKRRIAYDYFMLLCDCLGVSMEASS